VAVAVAEVFTRKTELLSVLVVRVVVVQEG
jgi:hypothetical protein